MSENKNKTSCKSSSKRTADISNNIIKFAKSFSKSNKNSAKNSNKNGKISNSSKRPSKSKKLSFKFSVARVLTFLVLVAITLGVGLWFKTPIENLLNPSHNSIENVEAKVIDESMKTNDGMPDFVLNRIYEIMKEKGMTDITRVGLYGLTYKENVDDMRESPTLQLLESQERHLANGLKVYDPFIIKDVVPNQYHDFDMFLADIDFVVIMVKHNEIKENMDKLEGKVVLDCHNICKLPGVFHI